MTLGAQHLHMKDSSSGGVELWQHVCVCVCVSYPFYRRQMQRQKNGYERKWDLRRGPVSIKAKEKENKAVCFVAHPDTQNRIIRDGELFYYDFFFLYVSTRG